MSKKIKFCGEKLFSGFFTVMLWLVWHKLIIVVLSIFLAVNGILLYQLISAFSCFFKISGRRLTSQGTRDLDRIAGQVRNSFIVLKKIKITKLSKC